MIPFRLTLCALASLLMGAGGVAWDPAADPCKNHYILVSPVDCTWIPAAELRTARDAHTATLLRDGRVLVVGGNQIPRMTDGVAVWLPTGPDSVELFDPRTGEWMRAAPLNHDRRWHAATMLADGRVLVVGGEIGRGAAARAEIYDPDLDTWTSTAPMLVALPRWLPTANLLPDGQVFVAGGVDPDGAYLPPEIYDPAADRWALAPAHAVGRYFTTVTSLAAGVLLLAGGVYDDFWGSTTNLTEVYDPAEKRWTFTGAARTERAGHTATLLADGRVLVSGGWHRPGPQYGMMSFATLPSSEVYDPRTRSWSPLEDLRVRRFWHTATLLSDGSVLTVGGTMSLGNVPSLTYRQLADAEIRAEGTGPSLPIGGLRQPRSRHTATRLLDGSVLVVGGQDDKGAPLKGAELLPSVADAKK